MVLGHLEAEGAGKWTYYYLYVMLDIFHGYIVGWTVQCRENEQAARKR